MRDTYLLSSKKTQTSQTLLYVFLDFGFIIAKQILKISVTSTYSFLYSVSRKLISLGIFLFCVVTYKSFFGYLFTSTKNI